MSTYEQACIVSSYDLRKRTAYAFWLFTVQEFFASAVVFGFSSNDIELCMAEIDEKEDGQYFTNVEGFVSTVYCTQLRWNQLIRFEQICRKNG